MTLETESNEDVIKAQIISQCKNATIFCQNCVEELLQSIGDELYGDMHTPLMLDSQPYTCLLNVLKESKSSKLLSWNWHYICVRQNISLGHVSMLTCLLSHG
jgi:hypothetical protein